MVKEIVITYQNTVLVKTPFHKNYHWTTVLPLLQAPTVYIVSVKFLFDDKVHWPWKLKLGGFRDHKCPHVNIESPLLVIDWPNWGFVLLSKMAKKSNSADTSLLFYNMDDNLELDVK